tara:strand:+ start:385 stop:858 length:474 start_codon:yes stop_codon:yes gene_type:complete
MEQEKTATPASALLGAGVGLGIAAMSQRQARTLDNLFNELHLLPPHTAEARAKRRRVGLLLGAATGAGVGALSPKALVALRKRMQPAIDKSLHEAGRQAGRGGVQGVKEEVAAQTKSFWKKNVPGLGWMPRLPGFKKKGQLLKIAQQEALVDIFLVG